MRFYVGTRVGRHMYLGTSLRPEEAAVALPIVAVVMVVGPIAAAVLLFNAMWLLGILFDLVHHPPKWGAALGSLAMWLGWWGLVGAVIWFARRKRVEKRATVHYTLKGRRR